MNRLIKYDANNEDIKNDKKNLDINSILLEISTENYIATLQEITDETLYIDFNEQVPTNYFRDIFMNKNSSVFIYLKTSTQDVIESPIYMTQLVANIWYTVLSDYLPVERFGSKIRLLTGECVADFVSDVFEGENYTIGYIHLGNELIFPEIDSVVKNRDIKSKCDIPPENFEEIFEKVIEHIESILEV